MSLPRSKSAPHVAPAHSRQYDVQNRPKLPRHSSAVTLTSRDQALSSLHPYPVNHNGRQSSRIDREEDPFSLAGFFPSPISTLENQTEGEWEWLRGDEDGEKGARTPSSSSYASPLSEEDEWIPSTPGQIFDKVVDEEASKAIQQEDKLGILSLDDLFASHDMEDPVGYASLLSPYCEDGVVDSDALYSTLCAIRQAHVFSACDATPAFSLPESLFLPKDTTEDLLNDEELEGTLYQRLRRVIELFSL